MATLTVSYPGSYYPYAIVRRQSDNYVWNGSAFAAWSDGSIGTYDLVMTSAGGDLYTVDFPEDIAAGDYIVMYYEALSSGTPTISDLHFPLDDYFHWDGTALTEDSDVELSTYALTTLDGVKRHMRIAGSGDDTLLTELINQVSAKIESLCDRQFKARDYQQWLNTQSERRLVLRNPPVQHITRISYGSIDALSVNYNGSGIRANVSVYVEPESAAAGGIRLVSYSTSGVRTATALTFATYPTLALMATAISAVSGWTATAIRTGTSMDLRPSGGVNAKANTITLYSTYWDVDTYRADNPRGVVSFDTYSFNATGAWGVPSNRFHRSHQDFLIEYRAGYETIPADVDFVCRELVKEAYYAGKQNTGVASSSLGPYSVSFSKDQEQLVLKRLASYMDAGAFIGGGA